ncbi:hypothetical protein HYALB_00005931 [Hymenoscyphus albidus]|uniref:RNA helicase n=1 Tax=Hymenoscyphus albidus TaxID=595503 RepID=A0A9N9Q3H9_9HELO|nr:hypothetical protein HYALB_00005931 [Hymenoscyphus albidus]
MSAAWETGDLAQALPDATETGSQHDESAQPTKTPQEHGWVKKQAYDYARYTMTNKQIAEGKTEAENGEETTPEQGYDEDGGRPDWAGNAAVYEWNPEEYGDVGPRYEELERMLFGSEHHVRSGIEFQKITEINVVQESVIHIEPIRSFEDAGLHPVMLENVKLAGYVVPTPVQAYTFPAVFKGYDLVACAQTGSGKTAAFLVPILSKLMGKAKKLAAPRPNPTTLVAGVSNPVRAEPLVLIVAPSRELATQIFDEARRFCYRTMLRPCVIYGGGPIAEQVNQLSKGCDVLIATPGRLCDFIDRPHILTLHRLRYMVIDEADEMLHNDWETEMQKIMTGGNQETGNIKYLLFSATFPKQVLKLAEEHLSTDHCIIRVGRAGSTLVNIEQNVVWVDAPKKKQALFDLLMSIPPCRTIIFVNSKRTCEEIDDFLFNRGLPATSMHSDRTQREREDSIRAFRTGKCPILVATGVSARGLDIPLVSHVINLDMPSMQFGGIEEYTHRIGRTGRIGNPGMATSFYNERDADIAEVLVKTLLETRQIVPDFLEEHIPEGYDGDVTKLKFEVEHEEEKGENAGATGGGWGGEDGANAGGDAGGWGADNSANTGGDAGGSSW